MGEISLLEQALTLSLKLSPKERIQLIERLASSVENEFDPAQISDEHWGGNLLRLLDELEPIELVHPEIDDPVAWIKQIRQDQDTQRNLNWDQDE